MGQWYFWVDPFESMVVQRQIAKEWRTDRERMHRGADVMNKARQG